MVFQVCNSVCSRVSLPERMRVCWGGGVSVDVIGPCLSPWLMAIGHWLSLPLFLLLSCSILPGLPLEQRPQALHHLLLSGVTGERRGERGGGGGGEGEDREKMCCREKPMEAMGRGRHARLSNLSRWIFNGAWSVYLVSLSIFTALSIAAPV